MAQIDEIDILKALRQPWFAPRQSSAAGQLGAPRTPATQPRQPQVKQPTKPR